MKCRKRFKALGIILSSAILATQLWAAPGQPLKEKNVIHYKGDKQDSNVMEEKYRNYLEKMEQGNIQDTQDKEIVLQVAELKGQEAFLWDNKDERLVWEVDIPQEGLYEFEVTYKAVEETSGQIQRAIMIDGEYPYIEARNIPLPRLWQDSSEVLKNQQGDEVAPKQVEAYMWRTIPFRTLDGEYKTPMKYHLTAGTHRIELVYVDQPIWIKDLTIRSPQKVPGYDEVRQSYEVNGYLEATQKIKVQGEDAIYKTDSILKREYDSDPVMDPAGNGMSVMNSIGGGKWDLPGQEIIWEFEVPESALYKLEFRVRQSYGDGLPSYRQIQIDGQVPFEELASYGFKYRKEGYLEALQDDKGEAYLFYLEEGKHTLSMSVNLDPVRETIDKLEACTLKFSDIIKQIIMVTGGDPDLHFDYELDKKIPTLIQDFESLIESMGMIETEIAAHANKQPIIVNNLKVLKKQLREMMEDPFIIPKNLTNLISAQTSLTEVLKLLKEPSLSIDYFTLAIPSEQTKDYQASTWQKLMLTCKNFMYSFIKDYDNVENVYTQHTEVTDATLEVWVGRGKEWAELLKQKIDEEFTPQTGIKVNVNMLPAGQMGATGTNVLTLSILSDNAPDVVMGIDHLSPVELAIRDAAVDLTQFTDYKEVEKRFLTGVMTPYQYEGGVYALPETMDFNIMFYRKDILEQLELNVPDTWEEVFKSTLPILNQNGMKFYYNSLSTDSYLPFLYQKGGAFYTPDGLRSALDSSVAYQAFEEWTKLFTVYQFDLKADFFNRFRTGEMPIGISGYNDYIKVASAAPELYGRWAIAPIPGTKQADGTINRTAGGKPTSAMILQDSKQQDEAWEFLKWWTSSGTQKAYGNELVATIGQEAKWNTANVEAFRQMGWKEDDLEVMEEQWKWFEEQPIVLGGYFTDRHIKNAATSVIMNGMNPRDALEKAVKDINKELESKQEEYKSN